MGVSAHPPQTKHPRDEDATDFMGTRIELVRTTGRERVAREDHMPRDNVTFTKGRVKRSTAMKNGNALPSRKIAQTL
jgi:hypothetical protein